MTQVEGVVVPEEERRPELDAAMRAEALVGLGSQLSSETVERIAAELDASDGAALRAGLRIPPRELEDVYDRVAEAGEVRIGVGLELTQGVYREVCERLEPAAREHLGDTLPPLWAMVFSSKLRDSGPRISWFEGHGTAEDEVAAEATHDVH